MEYPYFKGLEADRYSFYRVPKALVKADLFQKMSGDAKLLYAVLLDRMSLSIKNGWQDKYGNAYIICTIEEVMDSIHCARQKAVKLLDELEQEFRLIERRRQGLGKPNLLYVKDLYTGLSQSLFCVVFLSAGQCAIGNGDSFVPHASVARNGSTSNADRWICDFYDTAGGRRRGSTSGTGGSNASAGMVHIRRQTRIARLWNCLNKSNALIVERISIFSTMRVFHSAGM